MDLVLLHGFGVESRVAGAVHFVADDEEQTLVYSAGRHVAVQRTGSKTTSFLEASGTSAGVTASVSALAMCPDHRYLAICWCDRFFPGGQAGKLAGHEDGGARSRRGARPAGTATVAIFDLWERRGKAGGHGSMELETDGGEGFEDIAVPTDAARNDGMQMMRPQNSGVPSPF